jgi:hypothetical protein
MSKLVTTRGLCVRNLAEQLRGNGAILHCLPAADGLRTWCWLGLVVEFLTVWVRSEWVVTWVKHGLLCIIKRGVASLWVLAKIIIIMRGVCRLIRLSIVSIVMGFGVQRVFVAGVRAVRIIGILVAVRVVNVLN